MKWEYLYKTFDVSSPFSVEHFFKPKLNEVGKDGWELISVFETKLDAGLGYDCIFKRQIHG